MNTDYICISIRIYVDTPKIALHNHYSALHVYVYIYIYRHTTILSTPKIAVQNHYRADVCAQLQTQHGQARGLAGRQSQKVSSLLNFLSIITTELIFKNDCTCIVYTLARDTRAVCIYTMYVHAVNEYSNRICMCNVCTCITIYVYVYTMYIYVYTPYWNVHAIYIYTQMQELYIHMQRM